MIGIVAVVVLWVAFAVAAVWVMLDSVYGDRRLPGVVDSPVGLLAMVGWLVVLAAPVVALSTWISMGWTER